MAGSSLLTYFVRSRPSNRQPLLMMPLLSLEKSDHKKIFSTGFFLTAKNIFGRDKDAIEGILNVVGPVVGVSYHKKGFLLNKLRKSYVRHVRLAGWIHFYRLFSKITNLVYKQIFHKQNQTARLIGNLTGLINIRRNNDGT